MHRTKPRFRARPWGYSRSFLAAAGLLLAGIALQYATGDREVAMPGRPFNLVALALLVACLAAARVFAPDSGFVRRLTSVPAAVAVLAWVGALALVAGLVPQDGTSWPRRVTGSWPFGFGALAVLVVLGLAIVRRVFPWRRGGAGWLLNHLGVWLVAAAMLFGPGDMSRVRFFAREGRTSLFAFAPGDGELANPLPMPFGVRLDGFTLEEYPPRLVFIDLVTGRTVKFGALRPGARGRVGEWNWEVVRFIERGTSGAGGGPGGGPEMKGGEAGLAAVMRAVHRPTGRLVEGWVTATGEYGSRVLELDDRLVAGAEAPPRLYRSGVTVLFPGGRKERGAIEVNRPLAVDGWRLYQYSCDTSDGRGRALSVIEAVRDPWLPVAYAGMFLMLGGAAVLFARGIRFRGGGAAR